MAVTDARAAVPADAAARRRPRPRVVVWTTVVVTALVVVGYLVGLRSPWSAHHPQVVSGTASRVAADVPVATFTTEGGEDVWFPLDDVVWRSGDETGDDTVPPCLRESGVRVEVEVGLLEVTRPFGSGSYPHVLSVRCP